MKAIKIFSLVASLVVASLTPVFAVTQSEMDQARAIAAKFYIRYVNNGAGYLDGYTPASMAELEGKLANDKDRASFKAFKDAGAPSDYASWDKVLLASYWSSTFFNEKGGGLDEAGAKNGQAKQKIKSAIESMSVAAPAAAAPEPEPEAQADVTPDEEMEAAYREVEAVSAGVPADPAPQQKKEEAAPEVKTGSSGTWVYVMILAILIGVVIFLVVYAGKTLRGQNDKPEREGSGEPDPEAYKTQAHDRIAGETKMREKYAEALASKSEEIRSLTRQLADMEVVVADLKDENRELRRKLEAAEVAPATENRDSGRKEIFLGRVNARGIFVRADRHPVSGSTVYRLTTSNGVTGSFSVIHDPQTVENALSDPEKWLAGGCSARDLFNTEDYGDIVTEAQGTAAFEDGAWRVVRKAKIRYE